MPALLLLRYMNSVDPITNNLPRRRAGKVVFGLLAILVPALAGTGCGFMRPDQLQMITPAALNQVMQQSDILLIDVHTPEQKHIPGTDHYIPFYRVGSHLDIFPANKQSPIYLYCKSGHMGNWAARTLLSLGYTNIFNLEGGSDAWLAQGLPKPSL